MRLGGDVEGRWVTGTVLEHDMMEVNMYGWN